MTTITIKNGQKITKTSFENIEDLQEYLFSVYLENSELSNLHTAILDERLNDVEQNPANFVSFDKLKKVLTRRNV